MQGIFTWHSASSPSSLKHRFDTGDKRRDSGALEGQRRPEGAVGNIAIALSKPSSVSCDLTGILAGTIASDGCCFTETRPGSADPSKTSGLSAESLHGGAAAVAAEDAIGEAAEKGARDGGGSAAGDTAGGAAGDRARDAVKDAVWDGAGGDADGDAAARAVKNSFGNVGGIGSVGNGKPAISHGAAMHGRRGSGAGEGHNSVMLVLCCAAAAAVACNAAVAREVGDLFMTKPVNKLDSVSKSPGCAEPTLVSVESGPEFCETDPSSLESIPASAEPASASSERSLASCGLTPAPSMSATAPSDSAAASSESDSRSMTSG